MHFALATAMGVGYGDVLPRSWLSRLFVTAYIAYLWGCTRPAFFHLRYVAEEALLSAIDSVLGIGKVVKREDSGDEPLSFESDAGSGGRGWAGGYRAWARSLASHGATAGSALGAWLVSAAQDAATLSSDLEATVTLQNGESDGDRGERDGGREGVGAGGDGRVSGAVAPVLR